MKETQRNNKIIVILYIFALVLLAYMYYKSPFRLDDLRMGGIVGIKRLQKHFANYNGRYAGNITMMILTRLPSFLRVFTELFVLSAALYHGYLFLEKDKFITGVFCCLFFAMPLVIFTQTVSWISGFSIYLFSLMFMMVIGWTDFYTLKGNRVYGNRFIIFFSLLTFLGQLYLETATLYIIALSAAAVIIDYLRRKQVSKLFIFQFVFSMAGAVLMFSNGAYFSALTHDGGTYKSITTGYFSDIIYSFLKTFGDSVGASWFGINQPVNLFLSGIITILCIRNSRNRCGKILSFAGAVFLGIFIYDAVDGGSTYLLSNRIAAVIGILFTAYVFLVIILIIPNAEEKYKLLSFLLSNLILMAPLNIVSPIFPRCFLPTYTLWILLAAELLRILLTGWGFWNREMNEKGAAITGIVLVVIILCSLHGQSLSWKIQEMRMAAVEQCKISGCKELSLPRVPDSDLYCFGINESAKDWRRSYKQYYGLDNSVALKFVDYSKFLEQ